MPKKHAPGVTPTPPTAGPPDDPLTARLAELKAIEAEFNARNEGPYGSMIGMSIWYTAEGLAKLRAIDERYGIAPDDPRIYSIRAYVEEGDPGEDAKGRHFPGLYPGVNEGAVDSRPKFWEWLRFKIDIKSILESRDKEPTGRPTTAHPFVEAAYAIMDRLDIPGVPESPWPGRTRTETTAELVRIAKGLERDETAGKSRPTAEAPTVPEAKLLELGPPGGRPKINGASVEGLTSQQHAIVKALQDAGPDGLSLDQMNRRSDESNARKILKYLLSRRPEWGAVIRMAGGPNRGYRIGPKPE